MFDKEFLSQFAAEVAPFIAEGVASILQQQGMLTDEEWSKEYVMEFLDIHPSTLSRYIKSGLLKNTGSPRKQKFRASQVRALKHNV